MLQKSKNYNTVHLPYSLVLLVYRLVNTPMNNLTEKPNCFKNSLTCPSKIKIIQNLCLKYQYMSTQ